MSARRHRKSSEEGEAQRLIQAKLPAHLVKTLRILALEQDTTLKDLLTRLVADYIAKQTRIPGGKKR